MMNKFFVFISFLATIHSPISAQTEKSTINTLFSSVAFLNDTKVEKFKMDGKEYEVFLKEPNRNFLIPKTYNVSGSGFFVNNQGSAYLVTAEHVAKSLTLNTDVVIRGENDTPKNFKLKDLVDKKDTLEWTHHKNADVVTLLLDRNSLIFSFIQSIPLEWVASNRIPIREREVTTIGFPMALGFEKYFSPISKISKPSSGLLEFSRSDNNKITEFFLMDDPSISGFSGAPVLELPTQLVYGEKSVHVVTIELMGLVHGTISEKNGGGFAAVTPSKFITETINYSPKYSGSSKEYHKNGSLWTERVYVNGLLWNVLSNYDKDGNLVDKGTLLDGTGTVNLYDEDGKLILIQTYKEGALIESKKIN